MIAIYKRIIWPKLNFELGWDFRQFLIGFSYVKCTYSDFDRKYLTFNIGPCWIQFEEKIEK